VEGCTGEGGRSAVVGSVGEVDEHLGAQATLLEGSTGPAPEAAVDRKVASAMKEAAGSVLQQSLRRAVAWRRTKAGRSGQRSVLGVEVDSERRSGVGEHSTAVAMKRRRKVRLAAALRRRGPARGATLGAMAACAARGGWKAGEARRSGSGRGRRFDTLSGRC
jgi:hypothetical protein